MLAGLVTAAPGVALAASSTPYTAIGYLTGVPYIGTWLTNTDGQVAIHGNIQVVRMESANPRLTGRRVAVTDGAINTDGSFRVYGTAYQEAGAWDLSDPQNPKFTPGLGYWDLTWDGTVTADGSMHLDVAGLGRGGALEGLQLQETMTRSAGVLFDPAVPYHYTSTLSTARSITTLVSDDFSVTNNPSKWWISRISNAAVYTISGGLCKIVANYNQATGYNNTGSWLGYLPNLGLVEEGKTCALQVDLVSVTGPDAMFQLGCYANNNTGVYLAGVGPDYVTLGKTVYGSHSFFFLERPKIVLTNVALSLSFTRRGNDLHLTTQILSRGASRVVLYQKTVVDTPAADPCLSGQVAFAPGAYMYSVGEPGAPWTSLGQPCFGLWQVTDGQKEPVTMVFDNFLATQGDLPILEIQRAVLLSWPATGLPYQVEATSLLNGTNAPWRLVTEPVLDFNGTKRVAIPLSSFEAMEFYHLK